MICLLKEDIGADTRLLQFAVIFYCCGGDIYVHPADSSVFMMNAVDGADRFQYVVDGVTHRVFAGFKCQTFVSHILQGNHFPAYFFLSQFFAGDSFVFEMIRTIYTTVDTIIG